MTEVPVILYKGSDKLGNKIYHFEQLKVIILILFHNHAFATKNAFNVRMIN